MTRSISDEKAYMKKLLEEIVAECPNRVTTTPSEKKAQEIMLQACQEQGWEGKFEDFRFNRSLYANLSLHGGLALAGAILTFWYPIVAASLLLFVCFSYFMDSTRRAYILRRIFPFRPTQNLLVTLPAKEEPRLRIVLPAHVDTAFTGLLFSPQAVALMNRPIPSWLKWTKRSVAVMVWSMPVLAALIISTRFLPWPSQLFYPVMGLFIALYFVGFFLNFQVFVKNQPVEGANDNLSAVVALPVIGDRLRDWKPDDVEIVLAFTGAEEASLGGADALSRAHLKDWSTNNTVILSLDGIASGDLLYMLEGEVWPCPRTPWLYEKIEEVAASEERFKSTHIFQIPVGGTDAAPFLYRGYQSVCLVCIDPELGSPQHYHQPTDTIDKLDYNQMIKSIDFVEKLIHTIEQEVTAEKGLAEHVG